jgi:hypothetical protein
MRRDRPERRRDRTRAVLDHALELTIGPAPKNEVDRLVEPNTERSGLEQTQAAPSQGLEFPITGQTHRHHTDTFDPNLSAVNFKCGPDRIAGRVLVPRSQDDGAVD